MNNTQASLDGTGKRSPETSTDQGDSSNHAVDFEAFARRAVAGAMLSPDRAALIRENERRAELARLEADLLALENALGARYSRSAVKTYIASTKQQKSILERVEGLSGQMVEIVKSGRDVLLLGTVGTGKDHLLARLLYRAVEVGASVRFMAGQEFYGRLRGTMDAAAQESERKVLDELSRPDVLAISDPVPPSGELSAWRREVLYRLIDRRYRSRKAVWLTCNARSVAEADRMFSEPVWDRLQHGAEVLLCEWASFREKVAT